jgi:PA14 domain
MHLSEAIRQAFPGVRSVSLEHGANGDHLAVAVVADGTADRAAIADAMVRQAAADGAVVHPLVYGESEWSRLQQAVGQGAVPATLTGDADALATVLEARGSASGDPRPRRDAAIGIVRGYRHALDGIADAQTLLPHVTLWTAAHLVRRSLELLFASRQLTYTSGPEGLAAFDANFANAPGFTPRQGVLYERLLGSARQAEQAYWVHGTDDERRFPGAATVDEARALLSAVEGHLSQALTTDAERATALRRRRFAYALVGPLLLLFAFVQHRLDPPEAPVVNLSVITGPGLILGEYFAGDNFERKVFDRNDSQIALSAGEAAPDPELAADHWSVRWNGYMLFDQPGHWHLCAKADDGVRVYFNNRAVVDDWQRTEQRTVCGTVHTERGWYPIRVEYADLAGPAAITLVRGAPRRGLEPAPPWVLCCATPGARPPASPPPTLSPPAP